VIFRRARFCITTLFLLTTILFHGYPCFAFKKEPHGFRDIKWGTEINTLKNFRFQYSKGQNDATKVYVMDNDIKSFGGAELDRIEYEFYNGRFVSVSLKVKDLFNFIILKRFCFKEFGMGTELIKGLEQYFWVGDKSIILLISKQEIN